MRTVIHSHITDEGHRWSLLTSLLGHVLLLIFFLFVGEVLPKGDPIVIGTGPGGGQGGDFVTVGLSDDQSGGAGMYKPALKPSPPAAAPTPAMAPEEPAPPSSQDVFVQESSPKPPAPPSPQPPVRSTTPSPSPSGAIPREPDPGSGGPGGSAAGSGGGFGGGQGVSIGQGTGDGVMDSWYTRLVEQRIGQNWLKTSLGQLGTPVQTVVSFEITPSGELDSIAIEKRSGIRSVDLAAERAVRASNPLPPLPHPFRRRGVRFVAHFEYPPR